MINYKEVKEKRQQLGISQEKLSQLTGISRHAITLGEQRNSRLSAEASLLIENAFKDYGHRGKEQNPEAKNKKIFRSKIAQNNDYLSKLREKKLSEQKERHLIPLYDDVSSIGGTKELAADMGDTSQTTEYIDTGDWFNDADAAVRHYGGSMLEYPEGCILALKEVKEWQLIIWGRDYVVETHEYRITKRFQHANDDAHIMAYSTNETTYKDGRLVHEPIKIAWKDVTRLFLVLGYVVKQNGGTIVYSNKKKQV